MGTVKALSWNGPAFRAGLTVGARVTLVNGAPFAPAALEAAVAARAPVRLTFTVDGETVDATIAYADGLRYPRLERIPRTPDGLGAMLRASPP